MRLTLRTSDVTGDPGAVSKQGLCFLQYQWFPAVLVLSGTELIFFLVAGTVLCFGFSVRMMLITL